MTAFLEAVFAFNGHSERRPWPESRNLSLERKAALRTTAICRADEGCVWPISRRCPPDDRNEIGERSFLRQDDENDRIIDDLISPSRPPGAVCWLANSGRCGPPRRGPRSRRSVWREFPAVSRFRLATGVASFAWG